MENEQGQLQMYKDAGRITSLNVLRHRLQGKSFCLVFFSRQLLSTTALPVFHSVLVLSQRGHSDLQAEGTAKNKQYQQNRTHQWQ